MPLSRPQTILLLLLSLFVLTVGLSVWIIPRSAFSEEENRALSPFPAFTVKGIADGSFWEDLTIAYSDAFPLRPEWIRLRTGVERFLGKKECNGVFFGANGTLIPLPRDCSAEALTDNLRAIAAIEGNASCPVTTMIVPRSADVFSHLLPAKVLWRDRAWEILRQELPSALLPTKDIQAAVRAGADPWFRTDHHWTAEGAYLAYRMLCDHWGITPYDRSFFTVEQVSDRFYGTSWSKAGCPNVSPDVLCLWRYEDDRLIRRTNGETKESAEGLYDLSALSQKDHYRVFLGGNYGRLSVTADTSVPRPHLTVIKDSYANALVPFLALHFDLELIDPRYRQESLDTEHTDGILILLGIDTLTTGAVLTRLTLAP